MERGFLLVFFWFVFYRRHKTCNLHPFFCEGGGKCSSWTVLEGEGVHIPFCQCHEVGGWHGGLSTGRTYSHLQPPTTLLRGLKKIFMF